MFCPQKDDAVVLVIRRDGIFDCRCKLYAFFTIRICICVFFPGLQFMLQLLDLLLRLRQSSICTFYLLFLYILEIFLECFKLRGNILEFLFPLAERIFKLLYPFSILCKLSLEPFRVIRFCQRRNLFCVFCLYCCHGFFLRLKHSFCPFRFHLGFICRLPFLLCLLVLFPEADLEFCNGSIFFRHFFGQFFGRFVDGILNQSIHILLYFPSFFFPDCHTQGFCIHSRRLSVWILKRCRICYRFCFGFAAK